MPIATVLRTVRELGFCDCRFLIDIKDVQTVFGRNGSTCANPIPQQPPQSSIPDP